MSRNPFSAQVIQGQFHGSTPAFAIQARPRFANATPFHGTRRQTPPQPIQPTVRGHATQVPSSVNLSASGPGQALPPAVQQKMEAVFDADFSDVRVHVGPQAQQIGAIAFTLGSNLYFAPGQYNPNSQHGQRLIGHKLTHVVQQRAGRVRNPFGSGVAVVQDPGLEVEADRMGLRAAMAPMPSIQPRMAGGTVQPRTAYSVHEPMPGQDGSRQITVTAPGSPRPVGSVNIWAKQSGKLEITDLSVSPDHRRQGVGAMLMQAALRIAESQGMHAARLEARPSDGGIAPQALVSMYQRMGFHSVGLSSRGNPLMERTLSTGPPKHEGS